MYSKFEIQIILGVIVGMFLIFAVILYIYRQSLRGDEMNSESKLSVEQKFDQAEERNDTEILEEKMPWLDINSARWKQILLSDYHDWVPGPTDVGTTGLLTLNSDYLKEIKEKYQWYENPRRRIPDSLLTDKMEGYILLSSQDYKESYLPFITGNVSIFIDFDKEIVMFSY